MASLTLQRCLNHAGREAAARCPECTRFFCRECIVEHEDRVICAGCLARLAAPARAAAPRLRLSRSAAPVAAILVGLFLTWICFFFMGRTLLALPDASHATTLWRGDWTTRSEDK